MWKEFKEFAIKGNVVDLAVAVIVGGAFTPIVNSLVTDIIMPPISLLTGGLDFTSKFVVLKAAKNGSAAFNTPAEAATAGAITWNYGKFITLVLSFFIVAFVVFLLVRGLNKMKQPKPSAPPVAKDCPACTMSIPIKATRCPHCTTQLAASS